MSCMSLTNKSRGDIPYRLHASSDRGLIFYFFYLDFFIKN